MSFPSFASLFFSFLVSFAHSQTLHKASAFAHFFFVTFLLFLLSSLSLSFMSSSFIIVFSSLLCRVVLSNIASLTTWSQASSYGKWRHIIKWRSRWIFHHFFAGGWNFESWEKSSKNHRKTFEFQKKFVMDRRQCFYVQWVVIKFKYWKLKWNDLRL